MNETEAIKQIHALLDGREWYIHTIERIAEIVVSTGRVIREPLICKLCGFTIDIPELAHRHGDGWIGEDCCWPARLKTTKYRGGLVMQRKATGEKHMFTE